MDQKDSASLPDAPLRVSTQRCHQLLCTHAEIQLETGCLKILHLSTYTTRQGGHHSSWTNWTLWRNSERTKVCWDILASCYYFCYNFLKLFIYYYFFCLSNCADCHVLIIENLSPWSIQWMQEHAFRPPWNNGRRRDVGLDTNFSYKRACMGGSRNTKK